MHISSSVDTSHLHSFIVLFNERCISSAAKRCQLTQSALSKRIQKLEEAFGAPLFIRTKNGIIPTALALRKHQEVTQILDEIAALEQSVQSKNAGNNFIIGAGNVGQGIASQGISYLQKLYPELDTNVITHTSEQTLVDTLNGKLAASFIRGSAPFPLKSFSIGQGHLYLGISDKLFPEISSASPSHLDIQGILETTPLIRIHSNPDQYLTRQIDCYLQVHKIKIPHYLYSDSLGSVVSLVLSGAGCAFFINDESIPNIEGLRKIKLDGEYTEWDISLAWNPSIENKVRDVFVNYIQSKYKEIN